jgi:hypothetical protein
MTDIECSICYTPFIGKMTMTLTCQHKFCYTCFETLLQNKDCLCPLCRSDTVYDDLPDPVDKK